MSENGKEMVMREKGSDKRSKKSQKTHRNSTSARRIKTPGLDQDEEERKPRKSRAAGADTAANGADSSVVGAKSSVVGADSIIAGGNATTSNFGTVATTTATAVPVFTIDEDYDEDDQHEDDDHQDDDDNDGRLSNSSDAVHLVPASPISLRGNDNKNARMSVGAAVIAAAISREEQEQQSQRWLSSLLPLLLLPVKLKELRRILTFD